MVFSGALGKIGLEATRGSENNQSAFPQIILHRLTEKTSSAASASIA
jgi:hypothetical protein